MDLSTPTSGGTFRNAESVLPFRVTQSTWWRSGRVRARAGVGPFGTFEDPVAEAWIYSDFRAQRENATLRTTVSWNGQLVTLASFGSGTAVIVDVGIYEVDNGVRGARIAGTVELDEEILAEALQAASVVKLSDSISRSYNLVLTPGQAYRVELKLSCSARASFAVSATTCEFGSADPTDTGPNFAGWSDVVLTYS